MAARPHGSATTSREWSTGPHDPYWRTNSSFSPPPPTRWDFQFQSSSHDGPQLHGSSSSSNSRESRSWGRGNQWPNHHYLVADGVGAYYSSPSDYSPIQQWTPPVIQEINLSDYGTSRQVLRSSSFSPTMEVGGRGSTSSQSSHCSFPSCGYFISKPVHPLSLPPEPPKTGPVDFSELEEGPNLPAGISDGPIKCGLCDRCLSQRSPWGARRIIRTGDMPVAGVLSCCHVFHAECLDQITPKARKADPPCPVCVDGSRNTVLSLNLIRKSLPVKGNMGKEFFPSHGMI